MSRRIALVKNGRPTSILRKYFLFPRWLTPGEVAELRSTLTSLLQGEFSRDSETRRNYRSILKKLPRDKAEDKS